MAVVHSAVTTEALDPAAHAALVERPGAGAIASFTGVIRDHDPEASGEVEAIEYTYHPDADAILRGLVERVLAERDCRDEARVAVSHRVGRLVVGDIALACCVSTPHRAEAFALCAEIVEVIKSELPIWKRQYEAGGRAVWSNLGLEGAS